MLSMHKANFPYWQMTIICIMRFSEPLAFTSLFPYLYFMIRDFNVASQEKDISKFSGYLASLFSLTQFLCSVKLGRLSDRYGRKPVILLGLMGSTVSMLMFGFSTNYYMALGARAFMGAVNGNIAVIRTQIGELVPQRQHQAVAFMTVPLLWNVGSIVGPLIGGSSLLTRPQRDSYPTDKSSYEQFLYKHPYAMPNVIVAFFLTFSFVCGFLFLEETNVTCKYRRDYGLDLGDFVLRKLGYLTPTRPWHGLARIGSEDSLESIGLMDYTNPDSADVSAETSAETANSGQTLAETSETTDHYMTTPVVNTILAYFLVALHATIFTEFLPVFLASPVFANKLEYPFKISGGFGMLSDAIGSFMATTGVLGMTSILIYPLLDRRFNGVWIFRVLVMFYPMILAAVPFVIFTIPQYNPAMPLHVHKVLLFGLVVAYQLCTGVSFPQINLLIHRLAPAQHKGVVNATALSFISLARFVGPVSGGVIMSYFNKINFGGGTWFVLSVLSLASLVHSWFINPLEYQ